MEDIERLIDKVNYLLDAQKDKLKEDLEPYMDMTVSFSRVIDLLHHLFDINESDLSTEDRQSIERWISDTS